MKKFERLSRPIRCTIELSDLNGIRAGLARVAQPDGVLVQFPLEEGQGLTPGRVVELVSDAAPIGPLRTTARIACVETVEDRYGHPVLSTALTFLSMAESQRQALNTRLMAIRPVVVTLGLNTNLSEVCGEDLNVHEAASRDHAMRCLEQDDVAALVLGPQLTAEKIQEILTQCRSELPGAKTVNLVVGVGAGADSFQDFVNEDQIFYLSRGDLEADQLRPLIFAAVTLFWARVEGDSRRLGNSAELVTDEVLEICARLSYQEDIPSAGMLLTDAIRAVAQASAEYLIYDSVKDVLWSRDLRKRTEREESAASGLVGYVARTGERLQIDRLASDSRYDPETDNPGADGEDHFIAQPIFGTGGSVIGVVTATRGAASPQFSPNEVAAISKITDYTSPVMTMILLQRQIQTELLERNRAVKASEVYREEALEYSGKGRKEEGNVLEGLPGWLSKGHWIALALFVAILAYTILAPVHEYAIGPALVRARNKLTVTATRSATVRSVEVTVGSRIRRGDLLVRFYDAIGTTTLDRLDAQAWATIDGVVSDIRVRPGQQVNSGDQVASIIDESAGYDLIVLMPGHYAPQLRPGMQLVLQVDGYSGSNELMRIDSVGGEIVGPQEALRYAGRESTAALTVTGPVVLLQMALRIPRFQVGGRSYDYRDGLTGQAQVSVRSDPMIVAIMPGLKEVIGSLH